MYPDLNNKIQVFLALVVICFIVYANTLRGDFIYDDIPVILQNPTISQPLKYIWDPTNLLHSLDYLIGKENPFFYHLTNIFLHVFNTILVFVFLRLFFKNAASFLGAVIFAVHPIHAEAVAWITARNYPIISAFTLLTYILYYKATSPVIIKAKPVLRINWFQYGLSLLIFSYFIVGNFTSYAMVSPALIISDIIFGRWRKNWKLWIPFVVIVALRLAFAGNILTGRIQNVAAEMGQANSWHNPIPSFIYSILFHCGLILWPGRLTLYHQPIVFSPLIIALGVVVLGALVIVGTRWFKSSREVFFGLILFALFLAPTYSPITIASLVAERYAYFPSIALCIGAAFFFERYRFKTPRIRRVFIIVLIVITCMYAVRTVIRNEDWKNNGRLWRATLAASPKSPWAHSNMGFTYQKEENIERAIAEYKKAIELKNNLWDAYNNLGTVYHRVGRLEEALEVYRRLLAMNPAYIKAYNNVGVIYNEMGNMDSAVSSYQKAIEINPNYAYGYFNLSVLYQRMGRQDQAREAYQKAIALDPSLRHIPMPQ